ncbi:DNA glycosylase [Podospora didyma]|uniref:DNA-(apurinic or apyrimidinic site) lyase n=1 Tax=Podospora didyma TaxID=330526 RepID=A0AAE0P4K4_9PEZI|nr:DNA glycosylase [Podospora didyma]
MTAAQGAVRSTEWRRLPLSLTELCIDTLLRCGQSFRWRNVNNQWHCVLQGRIVSLEQDSTYLHYRTIWPSSAHLRKEAAVTTLTSLNSTCPLPKVIKEAVDDDGKDDADGTAALLRSYFALSHSLSALYHQWASTDPNFARRAMAFTGIRILNQDAWETLVAFICSSNNNISRISQMVQNLCIHYGPYIGTVEGIAFHDFPHPEALMGEDIEANLRKLGFGYRAKYIAETARIVTTERPAGWLDSLRNPECPPAGVCDRTPLGDKRGRGEKDHTDPAPPSTYRAAHEALLGLAGVGPKVSDCVCLMGLGWGESVPVDTHVWQIAQRDYAFAKGSRTKTFTKTMYDAIGDHFRRIWGPQAGWAQSVLFTANLKSFSEQASSGGKATKAEDVGLVKVEESQETGLASLVTRTTKRKAVKVEEHEELALTISAPRTTRTRTVVVEERKATVPATSNTQARKRKTVAMDTPLKFKGETKKKVARVKSSSLRTSKRIGLRDKGS